jgi:hypothetical protein
LSALSQRAVAGDAVAEPAHPITLPAGRQAQTPPRPLSLESLEIGGISALSTEAQVRAKLGQPRRMETKDWPCCGQVRTLDYDRIRIQLVEAVPGGTFSVFAVSTRSSHWITRDRVRVGDSRQRVIERYGQPSSIRQTDKATRLIYSLDILAAQLSFEVQNNRVIQIDFYEQLN